MKRCVAALTGDELLLSTGRIEYRFRWNEGHLVGRSMADLAAGVRWELSGEAADCEFPEQGATAADGNLKVVECRETPISPAQVRVEVSTRLDALHVRRVFRLYPDCPALACDFHLRGRARSSWRVEPAAAGASSIEDERSRLRPVIMHRIFAPQHHLDVECVRFFDRTDYNNNLVTSRSVQPYRHEARLAGNVLLCSDRLSDRGLFMLKEAPCSDMQLAWAGGDFICRSNEIQLIGLGVLPEDMDEQEWTRCYGFALGVARADDFSLLSAMRDYQSRARRLLAGRDHMILLNTWGDRGQDKRMCEAFVCEEIKAGARLGVTHLQLDHGWETTQSADGGWPLDLSHTWDTPHFWNVHPVRFPRGLQPCVDAAREAGVELSIWFNPDGRNSYEHWQDDAGVLIGLYRQHGIRTFKIDGLEIPDRKAEVNFRRMLDAVMEAAGGEAVFNLDITAGRRFGYHYFNEYGSKFLENRYTDWSNYCPHWTLRNLWMLSRCVPPQSLQIEFLNKWRNPDKYAPDDPLAPHRVPFDYCFAITMVAQPLAWFEASGLPEEAFDIAGLVRIYRQHQERIHAGQIFPIGEEPSGIGWTGFQSISGKGGYLIVYRELNDRPRASLACRGLAGVRVNCTHLAGHGADFAGAADGDGRLTFSLPSPFSFALYRYETR